MRGEPIMHANHYTAIPESRRRYFKNRCRECNEKNYEVLSTVETTDYVKRVLRCRKCGNEYTTYHWWKYDGKLED